MNFLQSRNGLRGLRAERSQEGDYFASIGKDEGGVAGVVCWNKEED
jgi:hypothetical protein